MTALSRPDLALYLGIYGGLVLGLFFLSLFSIELYYTLTVVASKTLYDKMLSSLMRAPMYFFDNNSIGEDALTWLVDFLSFIAVISLTIYLANKRKQRK